MKVESIQKAKQQWQSAVDAMPQLICLIDADGRVIRANRTLERWGLGDVATVNGADLHAVLHPRCNAADCYLPLFLDGAEAELASQLRAQREVFDPVLSRHLSVHLQPLLQCSEFDCAPCALVTFEDITTFKLLTQELGTQLERESTDLRRSQADLKALSASRLSMLEDERKRIACDLHDGLGQALSLIKLTLEDASGRLSAGAAAEVSAALKRVLPMVAEAMHEVRRLSTALRPPMLDDLGILATLRWFCRELAAAHAGVVIEKSFDVREEQIPAALKLPIYRIVQEAAHNVLEHAQASTLHIGLTWSDGKLRLSVEDDGCGFDSAHPQRRDSGMRGLGLLGMEERALLSAGRYQLQSSAGRGTRVEVTWPCR